MTDEPKAANVVEAVARVMRDMPAVDKGGKNKDQGYSFRGIEQVTAALQPLLGRHGVVVVPTETDWDLVDVTINGKPWTESRIKVRYTIYGPGGPNDYVVAGPFLGIGRDNSDKAANKSRSQAFKYALCEVFCIGDKQDDADNSTPERDSVRQDGPVTPAMVGTFVTRAVENGLTDDEIKQLVRDVTLRTDDPNEMQQSEWPALRDAYKAFLTAKPKPEAEVPA